MKQVIEKFSNLLSERKSMAILEYIDGNGKPNIIIDNKANVDDFIDAIHTAIGEDENGTATIQEAIDYDYGYCVELQVLIEYPDGQDSDSREYHLYYATKY
jgi:hypothetical protein